MDTRHTDDTTLYHFGAREKTITSNKQLKKKKKLSIGINHWSQSEFCSIENTVFVDMSLTLVRLQAKLVVTSLVLTVWCCGLPPPPHHYHIRVCFISKPAYKIEYSWTLLDKYSNRKMTKDSITRDTLMGSLTPNTHAEFRSFALLDAHKVQQFTVHCNIGHINTMYCFIYLPYLHTYLTSRMQSPWN